MTTPSNLHKAVGGTIGAAAAATGGTIDGVVGTAGATTAEVGVGTVGTVGNSKCFVGAIDGSVMITVGCAPG